MVYNLLPRRWQAASTLLANGALVLILAISLPVGLAMLAESIVYLMAVGQDLGIAGEQLLQFCLALVGRFRGGLGHVNVAASVIFSGMSGSAVADAVGIGRIIINMMTQGGNYTPSYAGAITAAAAVIGPIIPPSIPLVLYALISNASIGFLFIGGVLPGLVIALFLAFTNGYLARRGNFPVEPAVPLRELPGVTWRALPALLMPVILLGGIYGGVMTPTEAAAVAAAYAFVVSVLLYRSISWRSLYGSLASSARSTASVGILIAGAMVFNYVVTKEDIPNSLKTMLAAYQLGPLGFLLVVNAILLVLGCLLEGSTIMLVVVPIFIPTAKALGIDMVHFGLIVTVNIMIGLVTPPYGLLLFIVANMTKAPLRLIIRDALPFIVILIAALAVITLMPSLVLALPRAMGYKG